MRFLVCILCSFVCSCTFPDVTFEDDNDCATTSSSSSQSESGKTNELCETTTDSTNESKSTSSTEYNSK